MVVTVSDFNNNPDAPTGASFPFQTTDPTLEKQYILNLIKSNIQASPPFTYQDATPSPNRIFITTPDAVVGDRASLDITGGWSLTTASPAYLSFLTDSFADAAYVPFVIDSVAPGDSLSIYGPGGVLWSQPLSDFTLGNLYFAQVPAQTGDYGAPVALTYYLHNDTESQHSSIWFPEDVTLTSDATSVPEPSTLSLIGLGFAALGFTRRKRKHS